MLISFVVAMDEQGVVGINNTLPWRLSADLQNFKKITLGKPIVMGRKTYESIGKALPGRENIVITRQRDYRPEGCTVFSSLDDVYEYCADIPEVIIIGGAELFKQTLDHAERIYLSEVHARVEGDAFFPDLNRDDWQEVSREEFPADEKNEYPFSFIVLERK